MTVNPSSVSPTPTSLYPPLHFIYWQPPGTIWSVRLRGEQFLSVLPVGTTHTIFLCFCEHLDSPASYCYFNHYKSMSDPSLNLTLILILNWVEFPNFFSNTPLWTIPTSPDRPPKNLDKLKKKIIKLTPINVIFYSESNSITSNNTKIKSRR